MNSKKIKNFINTVILVYQSSEYCFVINIILDILAGILLPARIYIWKNILDEISLALKSHFIQKVLFWVFCHCGCSILLSFVKYISTYYKDMQIDYLNLSICNKIQNKIIGLEMEHFDNSNQYNNLSKINNQALDKSVSIIENISLLLQYCVSLVGVIGILLSFSKRLVVISIFSYIPVFIVNLKIVNKMYTIYENRVEKLRLVENLKSIAIQYENIKEIKIYRLGEYLKNKILDVLLCYIEDDKIIRRNRIGNQIGANIVQYIISYCLRIYTIIRSIALHLSLGTFIMYINALDNIQLNISNILNIFSNFHNNLLYIGALFDFLQLSPDKDNSKKLKCSDLKTIQFEHVYFKYPNTNKYILEDLSINIQKGNSYLLVGLNGTGKTTLVKLLCGIYKPTKGKIFVNGKNIEDYDKDSYRKNICAVFQDFIKYPLSVRENIQVGNCECKSKELLINSARSSEAMEFIEKLPQKFDTVLKGEWNNGMEISNGQWQKIAISRALYSKASFIIMDEPTASLDTEAEHRLYRKMEKSFAQNTICFIISHRFSVATIVNQILVLDQGKIVERGTFDQLYKKGTKFAYLFNLQLDGYQKKNDSKEI